MTLLMILLASTRLSHAADWQAEGQTARIKVDNFGYELASRPAAWMDATGAMPIVNPASISIGFPFKFYDRVYTTIQGGVTNTEAGIALAFSSPTLAPSNFVAAGGGDIRSAAISAKMAGTAPNRYLLIQLLNVKNVICERGGCIAHGKSDYQYILHERGDIDINLRLFDDSAFPLTPYPFIRICDWTNSDCGQASLDVPTSDQLSWSLLRPSPQARLVVSAPSLQTALSSPAKILEFPLVVHNRGDLSATDQFEIGVTSTWPISLYAQQSGRQLADGNENGTIDTGPMAEGEIARFTVTMRVPPTATLGNHSTALLSLYSSREITAQQTVTLQAAIPAPFLMAVMSSTAIIPSDQPGQTDPSNVKRGIGLYVAESVAQRTFALNAPAFTDSAVWDLGWPYEVAELPSGNYIVVRSELEELTYTTVNMFGDLVSPVQRINISSSNQRWALMQDRLQLAVAPDGSIGMIMLAKSWDAPQDGLQLLFTMLDPTGRVVVAPTAVGPTSGATLKWDDATLIVATQTSDFVLVWSEHPSPLEAVLMRAVFSKTGTVSQSPAVFLRDPTITDFYAVRAARLGPNVLVSYRTGTGVIEPAMIKALILDRTGVVIHPVETVWSTYSDHYSPIDQFRVVVLSTSQAALVWLDDRFSVHYAILNVDGTLAAGFMTLDPGGDSITLMDAVNDEAGHLLIFLRELRSSYMLSGYVYRDNLLYALVDSAGTITPPTIVNSMSSRWLLPTVDYRLTTHRPQWPAGASLYVRVPERRVIAPGTAVHVPIQLTNRGLTDTTDVVVTATLETGTVYVSDSAEVSPTVTTGPSHTTLVWHLSPLQSLQDSTFDLIVNHPANDYGVKSHIQVEAYSSAVDGQPTGHTGIAQLWVTRLFYLPLIDRN